MISRGSSHITFPQEPENQITNPRIDKFRKSKKGLSEGFKGHAQANLGQVVHTSYSLSPPVCEGLFSSDWPLREGGDI